MHSAHSGSWVSSLHFSEISQVCCKVILKSALVGAFTPCNLASTITCALSHPHSSQFSLFISIQLDNFFIYILIFLSFIWVYVHIYIHICHVFEHTYMYIWIYFFINVFIYTYIYIFVYTYTNVYIYVYIKVLKDLILRQIYGITFFKMRGMYLFIS